MNTSTPTSPKPPSPLKLLLLGEPGARKTTFMLQFPDIHVLDCDRNLDGATKFLREGLKDPTDTKKNVSAFLPNLSYTWDDIRIDEDGVMLDIAECYDRVVDKLLLFKTDKAYQARKIVGLDSLSHLNEFIIRKILKLKGKPSMEINLWTDFSSAAYSILVAKLEQTGKSIVCTCHLEKITETDQKDIMKKILKEVNPLFSGRVGDCLGAFFTDVWLLEKRPSSGGRVENWLVTDATPQCKVLKNSLGMPAEIDVTSGFSAIEKYTKGRI